MEVNFMGMDGELMAQAFYYTERTGSTDAPSKWNETTRLALSLCVGGWRTMGWGVKIGGELFTHLVWADNIFLLDQWNGY